MVDGIRSIEKSLHSNYSKTPLNNSDRTRNIFGKSLSVRRDMVVGEKITINEIETIKQKLQILNQG